MKVGYDQLLEHSVAGSTYVAFDRHNRGNMSVEGGEIEEFVGTDGIALYWRKGFVPVGSATTALQSAALIACAKPASVGALPPVIKKIHGGSLTDTDGCVIHEDCYLKTLKLSRSMDNIVLAEYTWLALSSDFETVASRATAITVNPFPWHAGTVLWDTSTELQTQDWSVEVNTGVHANTDQDGETAGSQRAPKEILPGDWKVSVSATVGVPTGLSLFGDTLAGLTLAVSTTNTDSPAKTFALSLAGGNQLHLNREPIELVGGAEKAMFRVELVGTTNDLNLMTCTIG